MLWNQRLVPSIGNIEKDMWVSNCLNRNANFSSTENFCNSAKVSNFEIGFFTILWVRHVKVRVSEHSSTCLHYKENIAYALCYKAD